MNDIDRKKLDSFETRLCGCERRIEDLDKNMTSQFKQLEENHLPHMEKRLEEKIERRYKDGWNTFVLGISVIGIIVALFGVLTLIGG